MLALLPALLFAWGALLVRHTLLDASPCADIAAAGLPALNRLIVVVVDGLRWADAGEVFPHHPSSFRARLVAHPPTATLPSIRSMLTGGLPAFADVGAGVVYGSQAVAEDTWVGRVRACRSRSGSGAAPPRVVAWGDVAWKALLGGQVDAGSWSTPALDVGSTDDSRVWASLRREVQRWAAAAGSSNHPRPAVAIAHVNALDHAQHAQGPGSALARTTLGAIRTNLTALARSWALPAACASRTPTNTPLLLILGDHGATRDGNHGGATADETDTALIAVSTQAWWCANGHTGALPLPPRAVHTVDVAPALALLLGAPPPFSSVGRLPEGLWGLVHGRHAYPAALQVNAAQVSRYLRAAPWTTRQRASTGVRHALSHLEAGDGAWSAGNDTGRAVWEWEAGLDAALDAARADHATFGRWRMGVGLVGLVAAAVHQVAAVVMECRPAKPQPRRVFTALAPLLLAAAHAASFFSVGALQAEGWVVAGLVAVALAAGGTTSRTPLLFFAFNAAFLPRAPRTAAEAMHQIRAPQRRRLHDAAVPWLLLAAQLWLISRGNACHAPVSAGVAHTLAAHTAFHASGHFPEVAGLRMDLTSGLPYVLSVAVVAIDTLVPFYLAGAAAAAAGPRVAAAASAARTLTLSGAALSAAWHARHILAPSVFAPRFVFELAFYVSAEVGARTVKKKT